MPEESNSTDVCRDSAASRQTFHFRIVRRVWGLPKRLLQIEKIAIAEKDGPGMPTGQTGAT